MAKMSIFRDVAVDPGLSRDGVEPIPVSEHSGRGRVMTELRQGPRAGPLPPRASCHARLWLVIRTIFAVTALGQRFRPAPEPSAAEVSTRPTSRAV